MEAVLKINTYGWQKTERWFVRKVNGAKKGEYRDPKCGENSKQSSNASEMSEVIGADNRWWLLILRCSFTSSESGPLR